MQSQAQKPTDFTLKNWLNIAKLVLKKNGEDNLSLVSAGVAFYFLLALFPLIGSLISLYGLFLGADSLSQHISYITALVPSQSSYIIEDQIKALVHTDDAVLGFGFVTGFALSIWSSGKGAAALITACNITYNERKARSFFSRIFVRLKITVSLILLIVFMAAWLVIMPILIELILGNFEHEWLLRIIKWLTSITIFILALSALYRKAPHRNQAKWRWVTPGAIAASVMWVVLSYLFNLYVTEYASYNETYGSVGGIIILLMWFYLTAYVILLGSAINAASELHTEYDTTIGPAKPIGERGAVVADTIISENDQ